MSNPNQQPRPDVITYGEYNWRDGSICYAEDPELFFPDGNAQRDIREAKRVCGRCAVRTFCLENALDNHEYFGVWGGASEAERRRIVAKRIATGYSTAN